VIQDNPKHNIDLNVASFGLIMAEDVVIEPMTKDDIPAVCEMVRRGIGAFEEAGNVLASTFRRLDNFESFYKAVGSTYFVARDKRHPETLLGGAGIGPLHGLSPLECLGEIRDLVVNLDSRGHGIGARLLKRCIEDSKNLGYQRLYLETTSQMEQARKLFMRNGFRAVTTGAPKVGQGDFMPCYYILESLSEVLS
jgi:putative acetyltransferase